MNADLVVVGAGVVGLADASGRLAQDFVIEAAPASVHVLNAVSPAFTAALPLGEHLAGVLEASAVDAHGL